MGVPKAIIQEIEDRWHSAIDMHGEPVVVSSVDLRRVNYLDPKKGWTLGKKPRKKDKELPKGSWHPVKVPGYEAAFYYVPSRIRHASPVLSHEEALAELARVKSAFRAGCNEGYANMRVEKGALFIDIYGEAP